MEELLKLNKEDIAKNLKPQSLRTIQIIQFAIIIGPLLFFGVCLLLHAMGKGSPAGEPELEMLMLPITGLMFLGSLVAVGFVPNLILKPDSLAGRAAGMAGDPVEWALSIHRVVVIIRMALLEGAALFGLVVLLLAVMGGRLFEYPILWLSTLPLLVHVACGLITFPSKNSVVEFIDTRIVKPLRRRSG
jgi:hypothetical protein